MKVCDILCEAHTQPSLSGGEDKGNGRGKGDEIRKIERAALLWRQSLVNFGFFENLASVVLACLAEMRDIVLRLSQIRSSTTVKEGEGQSRAKLADRRPANSEPTREASAEEKAKAELAMLQSLGFI